MFWLRATEVIAMVATLYIVYLLVKEIIAVIKKSNSGEGGGKCDLD